MNELINIFKALSDDTRLRILKLLEAGELCVCDIVAALGIIQPKISFHLRILKKAKLLKDRKDGKWIRYSLDDSDLFKRFLYLTIFERISDRIFSDDKKRLDDFLKKKSQGLIDPEEVCSVCKNKVRRKV